MKVPLAKTSFDSSDEQAVVEVLRSGWVGQGPKVAALEEAFGRYVGSPHSIAVSSCTAALHLAALASGWGEGDEVIVPAFTWISTPNAAEYVGARPVFCDIDPVSMNIDAADALARVTPRTRGIIPVHLFGLAAELEALLTASRRAGFLLVEDAACALGTFVDGRHVGTFGDIGCFSFHPRKSITTGEGGMLTTSSETTFRAFRRLRDIGSDRDGQSAESAELMLIPDFRDLGYNLRLSDLQAAVGITQLAKFERLLAQRREAARYYDERIGGSKLAERLRTPPALGERHSYQAYVCMLRAPDEGSRDFRAAHDERNRLMKRLSSIGIGSRPGTHAPHLTTYYREKYGFKPEDFPNAWRADWLSLTLPLFSGMTQDQQEYVCEALERFFDESAGG